LATKNKENSPTQRRTAIIVLGMHRSGTSAFSRVLSLCGAKLPNNLKCVDGNQIADLHIWSIGPGIYSATLAVVSDAPGPPEYYKNLIPKDLGIVHTIVEVHQSV
jgi:Co/Zn/Cd efflux system component